jgi:hypothetical protein
MSISPRVIFIALSSNLQLLDLFFDTGCRGLIIE